MSIDGKTANGLVRYSEKYQILSVIDSTKAGLDAGSVLGDGPNGIPVVAGLAERRSMADRARRRTSSSAAWRRRAACSRRTSASSCSTPSGRGMSIVNGLARVPQR